MQGGGAEDGHDRPIEDLPPASATRGSRENHDADRPERNLDAEVVNEQDGGRFLAETRLGDRQRKVAVVINPGGEGKRAALPRLPRAEERGCVVGHRVAEDDGGKADEWSENDVA